MIWRWGTCTLKLLNLCCRNLLVRRCKSILIKLMLVRITATLDIPSLSRRMRMSLSSMGMVVKGRELRRRMRLALTRRRVTILLLLLLKGLRESLLVVHGERFESSPFVFVARLHSGGVFVFVSSRKRWRFVFVFSRYPPIKLSWGQVAGSSCPSSFLCLFLILCIQLSTLTS